MTWTAILTKHGKLSRRILHIGSHDPSVAWRDLVKNVSLEAQEEITCLIPGSHEAWAEPI